MKRKLKAAFLAAMTAALLQGCATAKLNAPPDVLFKEGEKSFQKGNYEDAIAHWKKVKESYQSPELSVKAEINIADAYFLNKDYIEAAAAFEDFRKLHPKNERAGYALFFQALSYYNQINRIDTDQTPVKNALVTFQSYLALYPGGEHTAQVKEKILSCRDKQLQYEIYVGRFYLRTEKFIAAIERFKYALKVYPDLPRCDEVLYYLGETYQKSYQPTKAHESFERLVKEFPASQYAGRAAKALASIDQ